jgi:hypothetical protein
VTLNNWGQIKNWTLDNELSAKIHVLTAVTLWHVILAVATATCPAFAGLVNKGKNEAVDTWQRAL